MASSAGYKRRSSPDLDPSAYLGHLVVDNRHMLEQQLSSSRKRQFSERPQPTEISQPASKKQKLSHPSALPAAFWDNLSKIWLTKRALREVDRRDTQAALNPPRSPYQRVRRRPVTRNFLAESKRNRQSTTANHIRCCDPRILKDVKLFARHGGPDLSDLRNYPEPIHPSYHTMSLNQSSSRGRKRDSASTPSTKPTTNTTKTKSTGVYNRNFQQHLVDNAVYPDAYEYPDGSVPAEPNNWKDFEQILAQPRPSLSPSQFSDGKFRTFKRADAHAAKEKQVSELVIPIIEGEIADARCRSGGIPFTNLDPLTDGALKPGNPDIYYGARSEQLAREVRDTLDGQITPSTQHDLPVAPNFFLAAKGPDGSLAVAGRQACYDGALGARGMHSLQSYGKDEPVFDNAYTITSIYHGGQLKMYTSHPTQPTSAGGRPEYYITQLNTWGITGNPETFRQGAAAYRNARDWAKEQRDKAIKQANDRANSVEADAPASDVLGASPASSFVAAVSDTEAYTISQESLTSLNEDSNTRENSEKSDSSREDHSDYRLPAKRSSKHSEHSRTRRKRHNADISSGARHSHGPAVVSDSKSSRANVA